MLNWKTVGVRKRLIRDESIPISWRVDKFTQICLENPTSSILDIPRLCGLISEDGVAITEEYDATALLEGLATGKLSALDVTEAFCKRAAISHQLINCLTEIMVERAFHRATELDNYYVANNRPIGPFHGLPVSLNDSCDVENVHTTVGYVSFAANRPAREDSAIVKMLQGLGAVVYVKTNLSQTMMAADTDNNLFGRTLNPGHLALTAGGCTGGEGALIQFRGSILGVGADVAGSVRISALCNGLFGFKPTAGRIPFAGNTPPGRLGSPSAIMPCLGLQGRSVRDMDLWMKTIIDAEPWKLDMDTIDTPWRNVENYSRPLRLGLITEHPKRRLHPPMFRAFNLMNRVLEQAGHTIIPMDDVIPDLWESAILTWKYFLLDPRDMTTTYINLAREPWVPSVATAAATFPELECFRPSLDNLFEMNVARSKILRQYHELITNAELDGFIMPVYQATAVSHDYFGASIYALLPNLLNFPAGCIPFSKAEEKKDRRFARMTLTYEPPHMPLLVEGAPCAIQVVGKPMRDEETLKIMQIISDVLKAEN